MEQIRYYILFPSYTEGMKLESILKQVKIKYTIVPTPRELSVCCGMSIMYNEKDEANIKKIVEENKVKVLGFQSIKKEIKNPYL